MGKREKTGFPGKILYRILSLLFKVLFCSLRFAARERRSKVPQAAKLLLLHLFGKSRPPPHSSSNGKLIPNDLKEKCHFIVSFSLFPSERCFFFLLYSSVCLWTIQVNELAFFSKAKKEPEEEPLFEKCFLYPLVGFLASSKQWRTWWNRVKTSLDIRTIPLGFSP